MHVRLRRWVAETRRIHRHEWEVLIDSLRIIWNLAYWRAELYMGGKHEIVAQKIGLTQRPGRKKIPEAVKRAFFRKAESWCEHTMPDTGQYELAVQEVSPFV